VVAGQPKASAQPKARRKGARQSLSDWFPKIKAARYDSIVGIFEAVLAETRAQLESEENIALDEVRGVGSAFSQRLWKLSRKGKDPKGRELLATLRSILRGFASDPQLPSLVSRHRELYLLVLNELSSMLAPAAKPKGTVP
jgi:hypothetical protein